MLMKEPKPCKCSSSNCQASGTRDELTTLREAVLGQLTEQIAKEPMERREFLVHKISDYHAEDGMTELKRWRDELMETERRIQYLK